MKCKLVNLLGVCCLYIAVNAVFAAPAESGLNNNVPTRPQLPQPEADQTNLLPVSSAEQSKNVPVPSVYSPNVVELNCSQNLATLKWHYPYEEKLQPQFYRIQYSENGSNIWNETRYEITNTETSVKNLKPNINYRFRVVANFSQSQESESEIYYCKTKEDFPVRNPKIISAYRRGKEEVRVRWELLQPNERGASGDVFYIVYLFQVENDDIRRQIGMQTLNEPITEYNFKNLELPEDKNLAVWVNSFNSLGGSRESVHLFPVALETRPQMAPQIVSVNVIDANNATIVWNSVPLWSVNGNFEAYVLKFYPESDNKVEEHLHPYNDSVNTVTVSHLKGGTVYNLTVSLKNGLDELGPESAPFTFRTKNHPLPKKARFTFMQKCNGKYDNGNLVLERSANYYLTYSDPDPKVQNFFEFCFLSPEKFTGRKEECFEKEEFGKSLITEDNKQQKSSFEADLFNKILFVRVVSENDDVSTYSDIQRSETDNWDYICKNTVTTTTTALPTTTTTTTVDPSKGEQHERNSGESSDDELIHIPNNNDQFEQAPESSNVLMIVLIVVGAVFCIGLIGFIVYYMKSQPSKHSHTHGQIIEQKETTALKSSTGDDNDDEDRNSPYERSRQ